MPVATPPRITLLTDFGTADGYVAAMKGVIAAIAPAAIIDDASHDVAAGDVHGAAWALAGYWDRYPPGTVHVVVVDPGVGSVRRALAVAAGGRMFTGPDNGVFTYVLDAVPDAVMIELPVAGSAVSATFHGRDVFAPAAARLCLGVPLAQLGAAASGAMRLDIPAAVAGEGAVHGVVVHVDRFGNLVSNIGQAAVGRLGRVSVGGRTCRLRHTYADVDPGELVAVVGSRGFVEVAVRDGSAAALLRAQRGAAVIVDDGAR
jgi:S-adenosyl-L-methionine hydrolase (adenosine-forming)